MAGKHVGGSNSMAVLKDGASIPYTEKFMPSNDKSYAEGRTAFVQGAAEADNPFGADAAAAIAINQENAFLCWTNGWNTMNAFPGFQEETATADE